MNHSLKGEKFDDETREFVVTVVKDVWKIKCGIGFCRVCKVSCNHGIRSSVRMKACYPDKKRSGSESKGQGQVLSHATSS